MMHPITLVGVLLVAGLKELHAQGSGCSIAINNGGLPNHQPLLLIPGGSDDGHGFLLPTDSSGIVKVRLGDEIHIVCPGPSNFIYPLDSQEALVTCDNKNTFTAEGYSYSFREFFCDDIPLSISRESPSDERCTNGVINEIGFEVGSRFIKTIDICFDSTTKNALWSKFDMVSGIGGYQANVPSPIFKPGQFYRNVDVAKKYLRRTQLATVSGILGSAVLGNKYVNTTDGSSFFMSRGHLTAKVDFVYGSQQAATYQYINVAPQWHTFNEGNWNEMEYSVRKFASAKKLNLIVYTGTNGVTTLPDRNGVEQEIWLYVDANRNKAIPVPKVFWKVVYDANTRKAIAFLGVNNPYISKPDGSYRICTDVCDRGQVPWLRWSKDNVNMGISYCCAVDREFRTAVGTLPAFDVSGLLQ